MKSEVRSATSEVGLTLVCFALKEEAQPFRRFVAKRTGVTVLITGIGQHNARVAASKALALQSPQRVLTCGYAGGLNPALAIGDVIFETSDPMLQEKLAGTGAKRARFHCASGIAVTAQEKAELRRATGADAVEMESEVIHALCRARGIPCATVRVISDTASEDLPLDFNQLAKPDLSLDYRKLAWAIAKSPGKIPALLRLQKNSRLAATQLAAVLAQVL